MRSSDLTLLAISLGARSIATATIGSIAALDNITNNILEVTVHDYRHPVTHPRSLPGSGYGTSLSSSENLTVARRRADSLRGTHAIPLAPTAARLITRKGRYYMTEVTIDRQRFALELDTGSYQTWVATTNFICLERKKKAIVPTPECGFGPLFDSERSTSFKSTGEVVDAKYASGETLSGFLGRGQFGFGGKASGRDPYYKIDHTLSAMTKGTWFGRGVSSGVLGLAYPSEHLDRHYNVWDDESVLYTLFQTEDISPVFSLALQRFTANAPTRGGQVAFGGIPNVRTDGRWVQTPIVHDPRGNYTLYYIDIDGFDITPPSGSSTSKSWDTEGGQYENSKQKMMIDSGTTWVQVPKEVAEYVASFFIPPALYVPKMEQYVVLCAAQAPRVGIKIAGTSYYISPEDLLDPIDPKTLSVLTGKMLHDSSQQYCSITMVPTGNGRLILGAAWLKNVLVAFDMSNAVKIRRSGRHVKETDQFGHVRIAGREYYRVV